MEVLRNYSLKNLNTFGIDAVAAAFCEVHTRDELMEFLSGNDRPRPLLILGGGSNILFTRDFAGTVLKISTQGITILSEDQENLIISAEAGERWENFVEFCIGNEWGGLENLSLIPGQVGSSPIQNIGAYGIEMKDHFEELEALDLEDHSIRIFNKADCKLNYRSSIFKNELKGKYLILSVTFRLSKKPILQTTYGAIQAELESAGVSKPGIRDLADAVIRIRQSKLPDPEVLGNAGSFFKNPVISAFEYYRIKNEFPDVSAYNQNDGSYKLAAGWLIEQCGWKGNRQGKAGVHDKQALILVNHGGATGQEILSLAENIISSVKKKFGIILSPEVNIL